MAVAAQFASRPMAPPGAVDSARAAGLRYTTDSRPGIRRTRAGNGFRYVGSDGRIVRDRGELDRIRALVIPPAWTDVWISPDPRGHLQATGRDVRRRKQYRYHPKWRDVRDETKYERLIAFAHVLPIIRARTSEHLARPGLAREKVLAAVVSLLEKTLIRVGNDEYARTNRSYGLTTLRDGHVEINGSRLRFSFRGKSGVEHEVDLHDRRLARIVRQCRDLPGYDLFQYLDDEGQRQTVGSEAVNAYLKEITAQDITSKDFRTWAGTVLTLQLLSECGPCACETEVRKNILRAVETVAGRLGNTKAVCRKCYIHPAVFDAYADGSWNATAGSRKRASRALAHLTVEELALLDLLQRRASREVTRKAS